MWCSKLFVLVLCSRRGRSAGPGLPVRPHRTRAPAKDTSVVRNDLRFRNNMSNKKVISASFHFESASTAALSTVTSDLYLCVWLVREAVCVFGELGGCCRSLGERLPPAPHLQHQLLHPLPAGGNIWSKRRRNKPNFDLVQLSMTENTGRSTVERYRCMFLCGPNFFLFVHIKPWIF